MVVGTTSHAAAQVAPEVADFSASVGYGSLLFSFSRHHCSYTAEDVQKYVVVPINLKQIKYYFNEDGDIVGMVTWAWVTQTVLERLLTDPHYCLHVSEWCEGERLFIMDLVAPFGHLQSIISDLKENLFAEVDMAYSVRRRRGNQIRKTTLWRRPEEHQPKSAFPGADSRLSTAGVRI